MGSAPIVTSVRSTNILQKKNNSKDGLSTDGSMLRDLYNREKQLDTVIKRVRDINEPDRTDLLKLLDHMQVNERSALWIVRCLGDLLRLRMPLGKPYREATQEDVKLLLTWIQEQGYSPASDEKFRQVLKLFYKVVFGNNKYHPEQVNFFSSTVGHDRKIKEISYEQVLNEDQVKLVIDTASTLQEKAFCACLYETGSRPEEFLRLTNIDIDDTQENGIGVILRGKTGERVVTIISYASLLLQWLEIHPLKNDKIFFLWLSESTNYKNEPLGIAGADKRIKKIFEKASLNKKTPKLYTLRHTRATHLANILTHSQMCYNFGWDMDSDKPNTYIHLSGGDIKKTLVASYSNGENVTKLEPKLKTTPCIRCKTPLHPNSEFCHKCALRTNVKGLYDDFDKDRRLNELESKIEKLSFIVQKSIESFMKFNTETNIEFIQHAMKCLEGGVELKMTKRQVSVDELLKHFTHNETKNISIEDINLVKSFLQPVIISDIDIKQDSKNNSHSKQMAIL
jgi:site-specific recombinase XerD